MRLKLQTCRVACCLALLLFIALQANAAEWKDTSLHKSKFVRVGRINLHYLDWGGRGEPLLLLNGWGDTAHCFDDLAPKFRDRFHVLGYTRRGFGQSDKPQTGYDINTLVDELAGFMDKLHIRKATLVGHSAAGYIMTTFASRFPERVDKLVYLDALWNYALAPVTSYKTREDTPIDPDTIPPKEAVKSIDAYRKHYQKYMGFFANGTTLWSDALEAEMRDLAPIAPDGRIEKTVSTQTETWLLQNFIVSCIACPIDYKRVKAPALGFFPRMNMELALPRDADENARKEARAGQTEYDKIRMTCLNLFAKECRYGKVIEMPNTSHYCFIQNLSQIVEEMRAFLIPPPKESGDSIEEDL